MCAIYNVNVTNVQDSVKSLATEKFISSSGSTTSNFNFVPVADK